MCALLHDIGDTLSPHRHADVAVAVLRPFVSAENLWMVQHHAEFQGRYYFHHLGEVPTSYERHRGHPCFDRTLEFTAEYDQVSFDRTYRSLPIEAFEDALSSVLATSRAVPT